MDGCGREVSIARVPLRVDPSRITSSTISFRHLPFGEGLAAMAGLGIATVEIAALALKCCARTRRFVASDFTRGANGE